ncbi:MAG: alcohol dehydrogenase catalytic domain-containing protein [Magnetococcales bacterium]|nr:alcohol dehydrogenase catalytic domain-containing protein [Magnetococcales bacterium]
MRALHLSDQLQLLEAYPRPIPAAGEALIRVSLAGVCATDLAVLRGYNTFQGVLGHEFVGVVAEASEPAWIGQRVVGEINCGCGQCHRCHNGHPAHCAQRTVPGIRGRDGVFADYCLLPLSNLHPLPATIPDQAAVFVEPLAAALRITQQAHIRPGEAVALIGDGRLGLLVAHVLALTGCDLLVVGRHPEHWSTLHAAGISTCLEHTLPAGYTAETVVECSGGPTGLQRALQLVRSGGRLILKSTFPEQTPINLAELVVREIRLIGSRCGPFPAAIHLLQQQRIPVEALITACYPLTQAVQAMEHAGQKGTLKILIQP